MWLLLWALIGGPGVCQEPSKFVAFGDWGDAGAISSLDRINSYIERTLPHSVILLGDNFYPRGIESGEEFLLFSTHLARNISNTNFFPVLGNHDHLGETDAQLRYNHSLWKFPGKNYLAKFHMNDTDFVGSSPACIWYIDSMKFDKIQYFRLARSLGSNDCSWRILVTHYPIVTAGIYRDDVEVTKFRRKISPLVREYIDVFISGHEHSSQIITSRNFEKTLFLISGASIGTYSRSIDPAHPLVGGAKLVWYNDVNFPMILVFEFTPTRFEYEFVLLGDRGESSVAGGVKMKQDR